MVKLVEAVISGQKFILVAQVVFAELAGRITLGFQQFGDGRIFFSETQISAGQPDFA